MILRFFCCCVVCLISGCVRPQFLHTGTGDWNSHPTQKDTIGIYRSTTPPWNYTEIGLIALNGASNLAYVFEAFRSEAALRGANAIIDFDLDSKTTYSTVWREETDPDGTTHSFTEQQVDVFRIATGTLIRRN